MAEPLELKKTLNLPKTDFPMKASLPQNEPKQLAAWEESHLYQRILEARQASPYLFSMTARRIPRERFIWAPG